MKRTIIALIAVGAAASVLAQGTLTFNNRVTGTVVAKIYGPQAGSPGERLTGNSAVYTGAPLSGTGWFAELWAAPGANQPESSLTAMAGSRTTFRTGTAAGFITAPPADIAITGAAANTVATLQVRAWDAAYATYDAAVQAKAIYGWSALFNSSPLAGAPPAPSTSFIDGFQSFNVAVVPEPSTFALLGLGALGMLIFRRK